MKMGKRATYYLQHLANDVPAGMVVFLVALPLCLGVALASGAPLISGIVAGIVGGLLVSWLSGSQLSVSGPAAGLTVIVMQGIDKAGSYEAFLMAVVLAGCLQLALGLLKAGTISAYIPSAVIQGMLTAIGIILVLKQLPHSVGYGVDLMVDETYSPQTPSSTMLEIGDAMHFISPGPTLVTLVALGILKVAQGKMLQQLSLIGRIPGPLYVVVWGVLFAFLAVGTPFEISGQHLVSLPAHGSLGELLGHLVKPDYSAVMNLGVWQLAAVIAIVASLETLLSLEAVDKLDPMKRIAPPNQELMAQGVGNLVSGLLGGLPMTSVIVRSSANVNAGGKTKVASFMHGLLLLISVLFMVEWINYIPLSALSAILIATGLKLASPAVVRSMYRRGRDQFLQFLVTVLAILLTDLLVGVGIGLGLGLLIVIRSNFKSAIALTQDGNHYLIKLRKDVSFLNKAVLRKCFERIEPGSSVIIDGSRAEFIDRDILDNIFDFVSAAKDQDIDVYIRHVNRVTCTGEDLESNAAFGSTEVKH